MLAKGLLPALMACHTIDLVVHSLARCISAIHKQLPGRQEVRMASQQWCGTCDIHTCDSISRKKLQLAMALCSPLVKRCLSQYTAPRLKWLRCTQAERSTQRLSKIEWTLSFRLSPLTSPRKGCRDLRLTTRSARSRADSL